MRKNQIEINKISDLNILVGEIKTIEGDIVKKASVRIESEQPYSVVEWSSGVEKEVGDRVIASVDNNHEYRCEVEGVTGGSEPDWPTGGGTVEDGVDIIWRDMGIYNPEALLEYVRFYYHCSPDNTDDGYQAFNVADKILVVEEGATHYIIGFADLCPRACEKVTLAGTYPNARVLRSVDEGLTWVDMGTLFQANYVLNTGAWTGTFVHMETIIGETSGATGTLVGMLPNTYLIIKYVGDPAIVFAEEEKVVGVDSEAYAYLTTIVVNDDRGISQLIGMGDTGTAIGGIYSSTQVQGQIQRSTDKGLLWTDLGIILGSHDIYCLEYLGNGICLAGNSPLAHILKSTDFGLTWVDKGELDIPGEWEGNPLHAVVTDLAYCGNGICLATTYWEEFIPPSGAAWRGSIWRSTDYGDNWTKVFGILEGTQYWYEAVHYLENGICLVGGGRFGRVWRSTDYGQTWELIDTEIGPHQKAIPEFAYLGNGIVLAVGFIPTREYPPVEPGEENYGVVYRSTDYGLNWTENELDAVFNISYIYALEYLGGGKVLLGGVSCDWTQDPYDDEGPHDAKMLRSTDFGQTWIEIDVSFGEISINTIVRLGV